MLEIQAVKRGGDRTQFVFFNPQDGINRFEVHLNRVEDPSEIL